MDGANWYMHERPQKTYELVPNLDRTEIIKKLHFEDHPKSSLNIGELGIWSVDLSKTDSEFDFCQSGTVKGNGRGALINALLFEGSELSVELTKYERNATARRKCIEYFGAKCQVCNIDFGEVYGKIGVGFIHIHHISPISEAKGEYEVDPIKDLVPLCPNCHAMVHRVSPPYSVKYLKSIYQDNVE